MKKQFIIKSSISLFGVFLTVNLSAQLPTLSLSLDKTKISEVYEKAILTATLSSAANKDVVINFSQKGTSSRYRDFKLNFSNFGKPSIVAGGNGYGSGNNQFAQTWGLDIDELGNIFVADRFNNRIQKIYNNSFNIETIVGGAANPNAIIEPVKVKVLSNGNLYILETTQNRVVKWEPGATAGIIVAGGNGNGQTLDKLNNPKGLAIDNSGNIYISDTDNARIVKWIEGQSSGILVAGGNGGGSNLNQLSSPHSIFVKNNAIYISDYGNNRIIKWAIGENEGKIVAAGNGYGTNLNQLSGTMALTIDNNDLLYVGDGSLSNRIIRWDLKNLIPNGEVILGGDGGGAAINQMAYPHDICSDVFDNIYYVDRDNNRIIKIQYQPQIVIPAGQTSGTLEIFGIDDNVDEETETVILEPLNASNATFTASTFTVNVTSDDTPPVASFELSTSTIEEGQVAAKLTVRLNKKAGKPITANLSISGTATKNTDYTLSSEQISIAPGDSIATITITPINDTAIEIIKTINFGISGSTNLDTTYPTATINLISDDKPTATISLDKTSISEVNGKGILTATLSAPTSKDVVIDFINTGSSSIYNDFKYNFSTNGLLKTIAGGNGPGLNINQLNGPFGIDLDELGNIYISEFNNNRIQKVNITSEPYLNSIFLDGTSGLNFPAGIKIKSNKLYVADSGNMRIQMFDLSKNDKTGVPVFGGKGEGGGLDQLNRPHGIEIDEFENLYISDSYNTRVLKVNNGSKTGSVIAGMDGRGGALTQLFFPNGLKLFNNSLLISDNYRVLNVDLNKNTITSFISQETNNISPLEPLSLDVDLDNQFVTTMWAGGGLYKWKNSTSLPSIKFGNLYPSNLLTSLRNPRVIKIDKFGNYFVSDMGNHRVVKIQYQPQIVIPAGQTTGTLEIVGIDDNVDEETETIILEPSNVSNATFTASTFTVNITSDDTSPVASLELSSPSIEEGQAATTLTVRLNKKAGKPITANLSIGGTATKNTDYTLTSEQISIAPGDSIATITITPINDAAVEIIETIQIGISSATNLDTNYPTTILNVISEDNPTATFSLDKTSISEVAGKSIYSVTLSAPTSKDIIIDLLPSGTAILDKDYLINFNSKGNVNTVAGGNGQGNSLNQLNNPRGIFVDNNSNLFVADWDNARVLKFVPGSKTGIPVAGNNGWGSAANQLANPAAIHVDKDGNIYVADYSNQRIQKWAPNAISGQTYAGGNGAGSASNQFQGPMDIYFDSNGVSYVVDSGNNRVQKITPSFPLSISTIIGGNGAGNGTNQLSWPFGLSGDQQGNIYVSDQNNWRVQKWDASNQATSILFQGTFIQGNFINKDNIFYGVSQNAHALFKANLGQVGSSLSNIYGSYGSGMNQLNAPSDVFVDSFNNIYISDQGNHRIQKIQYQPQIVIPAGQTSSSITIQAIEDMENESNESIKIKIGNYSNVTIAPTDTVTKVITILDNRVGLVKQQNTPFPTLSNSSLAWGDYDRDGDQDLAIMGNNFTSGYVTAIYKNNAGTFENTNQNLIPVTSGDIKWIDLDKDGYLDLLYSGTSVDENDNPVNRTLFYKNNQRGGFVPSGTLNLPQLSNSKIAIGDLDNDGDLDLALMGYDETDKPVFNLFEKDNKALAFNKISDFSKTYFANGSYGMPGEGFSGTSADWDLKIADFDLDGDNDIIYRGGYINNSFVQTSSLNFYVNYTGLKYEVSKLFNATGPLTIMAIGQENGVNKFYSSGTNNMNIYTGSVNFIGNPPALSQGDVAAGDYNNDGLTDLVITGNDANNTPKTLLYFQRTDNQFELDPNINLEGVYNSTADWVDYDVDGDLDLILTGLTNNGQSTILYKNDVGVKSNKAPAYPTNLRVTDKGNGFVEFAWDTPKDDFSSFLGYNLRVGTSPGGSELSNTQSNLENGSRLITAPAPIYGNTFTMQLDPGQYYWSVQAIDQGFQGSSFAPEGQLLLQYEWKTVNQRNIINRTIPGVVNPKVLMVDFDNDKDLDMIVGSSTSRQLYQFDGKMYVPSTLTLSTNQWSPNFSAGIENMVAEDINNDGKIDVVVNNVNGTLEIYFNNGNGFTSVYSNATNTLFKSKIKVLDMDNDGNQEVLIAGYTSNLDTGIPKIYRIESTKDSTQAYYTKFAFTDESLVNSLSFASYDFGDMNNDGKIDFILSGSSGSKGLITYVYLNNTPAGVEGKLTLTKTSDNIVATYGGTTDLIDYDADGDLDIVFTGTGVNGDVFKVYENTLTNNTPNFSIVDLGLNPIRESKVRFGDFNGDGFYDIFYSGTRTGVSGKLTQLVEYNSTTKKYQTSTFDYGNITNAEFAFADIESDGDLDLVLTGDDATNTNNKILNVYQNVRNQSATLNNLVNQAYKPVTDSSLPKLAMPAVSLNRKIDEPKIAHLGAGVSYNLNTRPAAPAIKSLTTSTVNNQKVLTFAWNKSTDDHTPATGLTYNLRIGTTNSNDDILASNASNDGVLKIPMQGNAEHNLSMSLKNLKDGVYYWSVQAIDAAFSGSAFSTPVKFEILNGSLKTSNPPTVSDGSSTTNSAISQGVVIANLNASDPDGDPLTYSFVSGNESGIFTINASGQLILSTKPAIFQDAYVLVISVSDGTNSKTFTYRINLCESNFEATGTHQNITKTYKSKDSLKATSKVQGTSNVTMEAPKSIELKPGFVAEKGTVFRANIGAGCQ